MSDGGDDLANVDSSGFYDVVEGEHDVDNWMRCAGAENLPGYAETGCRTAILTSPVQRRRCSRSPVLDGMRARSGAANVGAHFLTRARRGADQSDHGCCGFWVADDEDGKAARRFVVGPVDVELHWNARVADRGRCEACGDPVHRETVDVVDVHDRRNVHVRGTDRFVGYHAGEGTQVPFADSVLLAHPHGWQTAVSNVSAHGTHMQSENGSHLFGRIHSNGHQHNVPGR